MNTAEVLRTGADCGANAARLVPAISAKVEDGPTANAPIPRAEIGADSPPEKLVDGSYNGTSWSFAAGAASFRANIRLFAVAASHSLLLFRRRFLRLNDVNLDVMILSVEKILAAMYSTIIVKAAI